MVTEMGSSQRSLNDREKYEIGKFDSDSMGKYKDAEQLIVEPKHWLKFDTPRAIPHPYAFVIQSLGDLAGKKVLEMGCGTGIFSVIMAKRGAERVDAFDISGESINIARKRAEINEVHSRINHATLSAYDMAYEDESYDYIVGLNILHHIDVEKIVDRVFAYLKPGGRAYFMEPFGNPVWLEKLRLIVPVKVNEVDKSHWQEKVKYADVIKFKKRFNDIKYYEFHLLSRIDRVIKMKRLLDIVAALDAWLLKKIPFLRRYARRIVIELRK